MISETKRETHDTQPRRTMLVLVVRPFVEARPPNFYFLASNGQNTCGSSSLSLSERDNCVSICGRPVPRRTNWIRRSQCRTVFVQYSWWGWRWGAEVRVDGRTDTFIDQPTSSAATSQSAQSNQLFMRNIHRISPNYQFCAYSEGGRSGKKQRAVRQHVF